MADHIDEFESIFRRAEREQFVFADVPINHVTIVTDGSVDDAKTIQINLQQFCTRLTDVSHWRLIDDSQYSNVNALLTCIDEEQTDLIVTSRHLQERTLVPQHSLGVYVDVLTQTTSIPILVLPGTAAQPVDLSQKSCRRTMIVTDHIRGDNRLINYGVRFCSPGGTAWMCHVEDDLVFERYMRVIEKIPEIDSDDARRLIGEQLQNEANQFLEGCIAHLNEHGPNASYRSYVGKGHHLQMYRELIENHEIDLLVLNTKDEDQLAMHGAAYSLSVELLDVPMLLI